MSLKMAGEECVGKAMSIDNPNLSAPYFKIGMEYLLKAIKIHPNYIDAMLDLGVAYEKYNKNLDSALYYYTEVIRLNPSNGKAFNNIAVLFRSKDSLLLQFKTYKKLYEYNPNQFDVNNILGSLYSSLNHDYKNAIFHLENAIKINNTQSASYINLGVAYGNSGDFLKAVNAFEIAASLDPKNPLIYGNLAESYKVLKQFDKEKKAREKLADLKLKFQHQKNK